MRSTIVSDAKDTSNAAMGKGDPAAAARNPSNENKKDSVDQLANNQEDNDVGEQVFDVPEDIEPETIVMGH
ncbi:hypothetical protein F0562_008235 [Nyssa sinensis]|uniref:Uncharacterized protein n=1 Tax=Nyssa sinensis TaxID=561372 RepID=A0A5J5A9J2_9ASTE|nr:hypothetical protein F0562_008235 [Nyssa sinensis]